MPPVSNKSLEQTMKVPDLKTVDISHLHPFMTTLDHLLMAAPSVMDRVPKLRSSHTGFWTIAVGQLASRCRSSRADVEEQQLLIIDVELPSDHSIHTLDVYSVSRAVQPLGSSFLFFYLQCIVSLCGANQQLVLR